MWPRTTPWQPSCGCNNWLTWKGLQETATDTLGRILELQSNLAAKGHYYFQVNPTNLAQRVIYDPAAQQWRNP